MDVMNVVLEFDFCTSCWLAWVVFFWGSLSEKFDDLTARDYTLAFWLLWTGVRGDLNTF